jgi:hypothetical protein
MGALSLYSLRLRVIGSILDLGTRGNPQALLLQSPVNATADVRLDRLHEGLLIWALGSK